MSLYAPHSLAYVKASWSSSCETPFLSPKASFPANNSSGVKGHAITYGFPLTPDELLAGKLALGLKKGVSHEELHEALTYARECGAYNDIILQQSHELIEAGLLEVRDGRIQFTRKGRLCENEICARFYSLRVIHAAHERRGTLTPEITSQYEQYRGRQELDQIAAEQRPPFIYLS